MEWNVLVRSHLFDRIDSVDNSGSTRALEEEKEGFCGVEEREVNKYYYYYYYYYKTTTASSSSSRRLVIVVVVVFRKPLLKNVVCHTRVLLHATTRRDSYKMSFSSFVVWTHYYY